MRLFSVAACTTVAAALLASCSGGSPSSSAPGGTGIVPQNIKSAHHGRVAMSTVPKSLIRVGDRRVRKLGAAYTKGIATAEFFLDDDNVIVFPKNNSANGPPVCSESTGDNVNDVGVDSSGNLIVPNAFDGVDVYAPPFTGSSCGTLLGVISDPDQASDAAAINAASGTIVVGNIEGGSDGGVMSCTLSGGCTTLEAPGMEELAGVAMDKNGNCYADAFNESGEVGLWVFTGCAGTGVEASGFSEPYYGGIDIDNKGNLVAISLLNSTFDVPSTVSTYSGCSTGTCTPVSGPTNLTGETVFGHVGRQNERFVVGDIENADIEVYNYNGATGVGSQLYSFNNGLTCATYECEAAAYLPNAQK